jgi:two-component SAPR family response regulator
MEATISASPDMFQLSFADTIVTVADLGLHRGDRFTISVFQKSGQVPDNPDDHSSAVSTVSVTDSSPERMNYTEIFLLLMLVVADVLFFVIIHLRNKYLRRKNKLDKAASILIRNEKASDTIQTKVSSVHLFGGFEVWNKNGEEITSGFSPLLKELFLLLVCRQPEEGITSSALREILWYDKNEESARNNRSVYFAKLRQLLDTIGEYSLSNRGGKWIIDFKDIHVDFLEYSKIIRQETIRENDIMKLVSIVRRGALLPECTYNWLDDVKAKVADYSITILSDYSDQLDKKLHPDLLNSIADALFTVDPLNDLALTFKCRYYNGMGKVFLSKQLYTNYTREYRNQYGEEYSKSYMDVIAEEN